MADKDTLMEEFVATEAAKAEDAAAAHPEPGGAGHAHGFQILLVGVGGTDRREMAR